MIEGEYLVAADTGYNNGIGRIQVFKISPNTTLLNGAIYDKELVFDIIGDSTMNLTLLGEKIYLDLINETRMRLLFTSRPEYES